MKHVIDSAHRASQHLAVENRALDEVDGQSAEIFSMASAKVIDDANVGMLAKMLGEMTANKSGAACDEDLHPFTARRTIASISGARSSIRRNSANWLQARSRFCPGRLVLK